MGTLIRTAAGLGLDAVLTGPDSVEIANPKTVRSSAGAVFHIPVFQSVPVAAFVKRAEERRHALFIADVKRGQSFDEISIPARWTLVVGGEVGMVDPAWEQAKPQRISLPMKRGIDSFNAAVAGAIFMDRLCRGDRG